MTANADKSISTFETALKLLQRKERRLIAI